ncbi:MAG: response regulator [Gammaproteobacteria bacterium]|nr:MAG: response regulator [Gammaproteobacteria bacterium]
MKNWGIKKRVLMLALFPMLVVALSLATYFNLSRINDIEAVLLNKGQLLANHLAPACEYGVFSGNLEILDSLITNILLEEDVVQVTIYNADNAPLISRSISPSERKIHSISSFFVNEERLRFTADITTTEIDINDFDQLLEADVHTRPTTIKKIGTVNVTLSTLPTRIQQFDTLIKGFLITLGGLVITVFLAIKISHGVVDPIQKLTYAVKHIAQGDLQTRINIDSGGEIGSLVESVNSMAEEIQIVRENLQTQIDKATAKLKKTLDELEIQNIELDLARNNALSASRIKSEFLANMSHEIRTPMNGVLGFTDLLYKTRLTAQQRDLIDTIRTSASNLLTIINDILDFSKIESGKLEIDRVEFNLTELMDDVVSMFAPMAYKNNLELVYQSYPGMPERIISDPSRIRQILVNLIGNAIKFTPQGHVIIRIIPLEEAGKKITLKFTVTDTGIGMDEQDKKRLFTAFTQADTSISRKFGGTGLGLVISKKLTELMHGEIGFESALNKGSTFWFSIELEKSRYISRVQSPQSSSTVLVYEPMSLHRIGIRNALHRTGAEVLETGRLDKIDHLIKQNPATRAILAGISRTDIHNHNLIRNLAKRLNDSGLPYLVLISSFDNNDIDYLEREGIHNILFRCSRHNLIQQQIATLLKVEPLMDLDAMSHGVDSHYHDSLQGIKVLVVDDNEINIKLSHSLLENRGIVVTSATDGEQAVKLCRDNVYDLVLMDLHMPKMDGFAATAAIRKLEGYCQTVPIIALTANILPDEQKRAITTGMNDILVKPITESRLLDTLLKWTNANCNIHTLSTPDIKPDNTLESQHAIFDEAEAIERAGGNQQLAMELLAMLQKELPEHRTKIAAAMNAANMTELKQHTHKLHGATSYCGVPMLRHAAKHMESIIDNNELEQLAQAYTDLLAAIDALDHYDARSVVQKHRI